MRVTSETYTYFPKKSLLLLCSATRYIPINSICDLLKFVAQLKGINHFSFADITIRCVEV
jgi:hypothetical protein